MSKLLLPDDYFSVVTADEVNKICKPLFDLYKITGFGYAKIYKNGGVTTLVSDYRYPILHAQSGLPVVAPIPEKYWLEPSFYYLPATTHDPLYHKLLHLTRTILNQDHPFYIVDCSIDFIEVYAFVTSADNDQVVNTYLNHIKDFGQFKVYFRQEASALLNESDNQKIFVPRHMMPIFHDKNMISEKERCHQYFSQKIDIRYYSVRRLHPKLTDREIDCLYFLSQGLTLKGIARQLYISYRTVESHLNNAKTKLGFHTKSEIIKILAKIVQDL